MLASAPIWEIKAYLQAAFEGIEKMRTAAICRGASLYETEPYGYLDRDKFLNTVFTFDTLYQPQELLTFLHQLEQEGNRVRERFIGDRARLMLEYPFYGERSFRKKNLIVPHREIPLREFVLEPLQEIAPVSASSGQRKNGDADV